MAITFGAVTTFTDNGNIENTSFSHDCGTATNRRLFVVTSQKRNGTQTVSGITCGGTALSQVGVVQSGAGSELDLQVWELAAPPTGSQTIVVTFSSTFNRRVVFAFVAIGDSALSRRTAGTPYESASSGAISVTTTAEASDVVLLCSAVGSNNTTPSLSSGDTVVVGPTAEDGGSQLVRALVSRRAGTAPTTTITATGGTATGTYLFGGIAFAVAESGAPAGPPDAPTGLAANLTGTPGTVALTWTLPGTGEPRSNVVVERNVNGGAFSTLTTLGASAVNHNDATVLTGNTYQYRVFASNGAGNSSNSNTVTANFTGAGGAASAGNLFGGRLLRS